MEFIYRKEGHLKRNKMTSIERGRGVKIKDCVMVILALFAFSCSSQSNTDSNIGVNNVADTVVFNQYKEGEKDGLWRTFHESGRLKKEGNYKAGLKEGLHKEWEDNGILSSESFYKRGKENGWVKWYHERGHLAGEGNMVDGIRVGKWKICGIEENGFCIDAHFKNGKRDGIWKIYHENAGDKLWREQTWKDDMMVSEKCWDVDGIEIECQ